MNNLSELQVVLDTIECVLDESITTADVETAIRGFAESNDFECDSSELALIVSLTIECINGEIDDVESHLADRGLSEAIVKKVSMANRKAGGSLVTRQKDRQTRARRATQTTGLSKSQRRKIARKAARTRKRDKSGQRKANKMRQRSMKKRRSMGY